MLWVPISSGIKCVVRLLLLLLYWIWRWRDEVFTWWRICPSPPMGCSSCRARGSAGRSSRSPPRILASLRCSWTMATVPSKPGTSCSRSASSVRHGPWLLEYWDPSRLVVQWYLVSTFEMQTVITLSIGTTARSVNVAASAASASTACWYTFARLSVISIRWYPLSESVENSVDVTHSTHTGGLVSSNSKIKQVNLFHTEPNRTQHNESVSITHFWIFATCTAGTQPLRGRIFAPFRIPFGTQTPPTND